MILHASATQEAIHRVWSGLVDESRQEELMDHLERTGITLREYVGFLAINANRWDWLTSVSGEMVTR